MDNTTIKGKSSIRARDSRTMRRMAPSSPIRPRQRGVNWLYVQLSLLIGCLLWFGVDLKRMEDLTLDVEVELRRHLPADWQLSTAQIRAARVTIRGPRQEVLAIRKEDLLLEPVFPSGALDGDVYDGMLTLLPSQVRGLPVGVEVRSVNPQVAPIRLSKVVTRYLAVAAGDITGVPQEGYAVGNVLQIDPPAMPIIVTREFLAKIGTSDVLRTKEFSVEGGRGLVGGMVGLEPFEKDGQLIEVAGMVYMAVELDEIPVEREFSELFEVRALLNSPFERYTGLNISPPSVKITVAGPKLVVDNLMPGEIFVYADLRDRIPAAPGEFHMKCQAITPPRVQVARIEPDTVKWLISESEATALPEPQAKALDETGA